MRSFKGGLLSGIATRGKTANTSQIITPDPYFPNVSLLLSGNGANNTTTLVDKSLSPKTLTVSGDTIISTNQSKFGNGSILFNTGTIESNSSIDFAFSNGDFTLETWIYLLEIPTSGFPNILETTDGLLFVNFRQSGFFAITTAPEVLATSPAPVPLNQWTYLAVSRTNSTFRVFLNGSSGTPVTISRAFGSTATGIRIGGGFGQTLRAHINEFRITKGVGREITMPTDPFPDR